MNTPASSNWQLNGGEDWPRGGGPYMGTNIGTLHHLEYPALGASIIRMWLGENQNFCTAVQP